MKSTKSNRSSNKVIKSCVRTNRIVCLIGIIRVNNKSKSSNNSKIRTKSNSSTETHKSHKSTKRKQGTRSKQSFARLVSPKL